MRAVRRSALLVLLFSISPSDPAAGEEPFVPGSDRVVVEILPAAYRSEERELRALRTELERSPGDRELAARVAWRYLELARQSGELRYAGWAEAVAAPWLTAPDAGGLQLLRATLRQKRHDFEGALADLSALLKRNPRDARAWWTRATILQVRGEPEAARASCRPLLRLAPDLAGATCLARIGASSGNAEKSAALLRRALDGAAGAPLPLRRAALVTLAEIAAQLGDATAAEEVFERVLALPEPGFYERAAHADFLLDRGRAPEVLEAISADTRSDALLLRRVIAAHRTGDPSAARSARILEARYDAARRRGEALHQGEEARYLLEVAGRPREALALAAANYGHQKEARDLRTFVEAALRSGDPMAEERARAAWRASGLEDVALAKLVGEGA